MKKYLSLIAMTVAVPLTGWAQANLDTELARELDQLYLQQQTGATRGQVAQNLGQMVPTSAGTYIVPAPTSAVVPAPIMAAPVVVQQQPTTVVEAAPLQESRADQARRRRQQQEMLNEQRIVEKLEEDRLRAEQFRLNQVFPGVNATNTVISEQQQQAVINNSQPIVIVGDKKKETNVIINSEVSGHGGIAGVLGRPYFAGMIGFSEYLDASFIRSKVATGVSIGKILPNNFVIEGSFIYSTHDIYDIYYGGYGASYYGGSYGCMYVCGAPAAEMQQYNFLGAVKYEFMSETIRPSVGGFAGLTYRNYRDKNYVYATTYPYTFNGYSYAFDLGVSAAVDVIVSPSFVIGAEGRYFFNAKNWISSDPLTNMMYNGAVNTIEGLSYYTFMLNMKFGF